jgi:hypothetical protein
MKAASLPPKMRRQSDGMEEGIVSYVFWFNPALS